MSYANVIPVRFIACMHALKVDGARSYNYHIRTFNAIYFSAPINAIHHRNLLSQICKATAGIEQSLQQQVIKHAQNIRPLNYLFYCHIAIHG